MDVKQNGPGPVLLRGQGLCESRGGRTGILVPNSHYGHGGRKATFNERSVIIPTVVLTDTVFVTLFSTTVETVRYITHQLFCKPEFLTNLVPCSGGSQLP